MKEQERSALLLKLWICVFMCFVVERSLPGLADPVPVPRAVISVGHGHKCGHLSELAVTLSAGPFVIMVDSLNKS